MKKLHLGCGKKIIPGWINIDAIPQSPDVIKEDIRVLSSIEDMTCSEIYACHALEHFGTREVNSVLSTWFRKLLPGGTIRLAVPDLGAIFEKYQQGAPLSHLLGYIYGGQLNEYDYHKWGYDFKSIKDKLESVGFVGVKRYDWGDTEHSHIFDWSQAYYPWEANSLGGNKETGTLVSLNIEATKPV